MEARFGAEAHQLCEAGPSNLGEKSLEWDLNDWRWDGDLFLATPLNGNTTPSECRNKRLSNGWSSCSEETDFGKGKGVPEKRRRIVPIEDEEHHDNVVGSLTLNLGGSAYHPVVEADVANWEGSNEKKSKLQGGSSSRLPRCQVEGCGADLSESKDYHRRHKVCEMHSKASSAMVNNVMQRFCQQCSRFHLLPEFDEGKRSCRRRLAGHNRRRRKTLPDTSNTANPVIDDQTASYLLITLLRILSNLHTDNSDQSKDQDLLSHLLKSLATLAGLFDSKNLCEMLQASQDSKRLGVSAGTSSEVPNGLTPNGVAPQAFSRDLPSTSKITCAANSHDRPLRPNDHSVCVAVPTPDSSKRLLTVASPERARLKEFDLNNAYSDTENCMEANENSASPPSLGTGSPISPYLLQDSHQSSPPQMSVNSDSISAPSRSSSNGDAQSRTDRIVFKLFGKDPNDFPLMLRSQILNWLSHSPTDLESYIRPGCIILTIYLHLAKSGWDELCRDLSSNLNRLLYSSADKFWRTGWIFARVQNHIAFIYNGKVLLSTSRLLGNPYHFKIVSVSPVAAAISSSVNFTVKCLNLAHSNGRLLCAFEGRYLVQETTQAIVSRSGEHEDSECLSFSCSLPNAVGRGFIEVEDDGLSSYFFPFIVAEDDVCSEIRGLENVINVAADEDEFQDQKNPSNSRSQALYFLNEMGWLLRKSQLRKTPKQVNSSLGDVFSLTRFKWLISFAMDQEWCAVVKSLLDLLFQGTIALGGLSPNELALSEGLLHNAVRKNSRLMVESLLRYKPDSAAEDRNDFLFRPDVPGPSKITPLHVVASTNGAESVLDALTDDPGQFGLKAWKTARDVTDFTPEDYARSRGHESYLNLVQKKIDKQAGNAHVVLSMPNTTSAPATTCKQPDIPKYVKSAGFEIEKGNLKPSRQSYCNLCSQQMVHRSTSGRSLLYRPAMLSMVGIAAVCVCVGLLFKGPPEVSFVFPPFRWESLAYGSM
ncbi:uncharacterized protein A4U43_C02F22170 [Asparagus officinalis]|uniref:SBP-type domain-containing protein n=1 Tax=Asparagus officinalis TaxID=4686 RepID=A0A5P1FKZ9_ASPOF|nr:squamosa promoter-binding-like protein 1 [Asparagus officinalis]ONK78764.1 uncharacterized protein A4U43_C02F22170 [Asparagus officinalis]